MGDRLYHGSITSNIQVLRPISKLHNTNSNVVYLTDNIPYALFYIWDSRHNKMNKKYVTAWIKDGITYYEEQFPNQMKAFYDGVKGYLYSVGCKNGVTPVTDRESMFSCETEIVLEKVVLIENVYEKLLTYEAKGQLKVIHYEDVPNEQIELLYNHIAEKLVKNRIIDNPDTEEAVFYQEYFKIAWDSAVSQK